MAQVIAFGAYRAPREVTYWIGLLMLGLVLAMALSGYLLPWDQKGYWATQVATAILGKTPLVGPWLKELLQGGPSYGNLTLTRFFTLHAMVLPAALVGLVAIHIALFRRHGVTPAPGRDPAEIEARTERFGGRQLERDLLAMLAIAGVLFLVVVLGPRAELEAPADPTSTYVARPEWYFLPLFQLLKYFEGPLELVGTMVIPSLVAGFLLLLPLLDRSPTAGLRDRKAVLGILGMLALGTVGLGVAARREDAGDPALAKQRVAEHERAQLARSLALAGMPPAGGTAVFENDPRFKVRKLWEERCASCHALDGLGGMEAPDLKDYGSRAWLLAFLETPESPLKYGRTNLPDRMKPVKGTREELAALVEYVVQLGGRKADPAQADQGKALFAERDCDSCHEVDGSSDSDGPNLGGRGSEAWLRAVLEDASSPNLYGKRNQMPAFRDKLSEAEIAQLAAFMLELREGE
jgi:ubiquinol-cytochrome c reductase cytochrome b subunit